MGSNIPKGVEEIKEHQAIFDAAQTMAFIRTHGEQTFWEFCEERGIKIRSNSTFPGAQAIPPDALEGVLKALELESPEELLNESTKYGNFDFRIGSSHNCFTVPHVRIAVADIIMAKVKEKGLNWAEFVRDSVSVERQQPISENVFKQRMTQNQAVKMLAALEEEKPLELIHKIFEETLLEKGRKSAAEKEEREKRLRSDQSKASR